MKKNKKSKNPHHFLVIYLYDNDSPPKVRWVQESEIKELFDADGVYPERLIIDMEKGVIVSNTLED